MGFQNSTKLAIIMLKKSLFIRKNDQKFINYTWFTQSKKLSKKSNIIPIFATQIRKQNIKINIYWIILIRLVK